jgi:hypothetical protein
MRSIYVIKEVGRRPGRFCHNLSSSDRLGGSEYGGTDKPTVTSMINRGMRS